MNFDAVRSITRVSNETRILWRLGAKRLHGEKDQGAVGNEGKESNSGCREAQEEESDYDLQEQNVRTQMESQHKKAESQKQTDQTVLI